MPFATISAVVHRVIVVHFVWEAHLEAAHFVGSIANVFFLIMNVSVYLHIIHLPVYYLFLYLICTSPSS